MEKFYHGTADVLSIGKFLLPPALTGNQREERREKYTDKVFFTNSMKSAEKYAKKAAAKYGGNPIVLVVQPIREYHRMSNTEYIADIAQILDVQRITNTK